MNKEKTKFTSHKRYLFGLLFLEMQRRVITPKYTTSLLNLSGKKWIMNLIRCSSCEKFFCSVYVIGTTCFYECFHSKWYLEEVKVTLTVCYYHVTHEFQSESTLYSFPECQGTPYSKQAPYLKFKWQQRDSNPHHNHLVSKWTLNQKIQVIWRNQVYVSSSNVSTDTTVIVKG